MPVFRNPRIGGRLGGVTSGSILFGDSNGFFAQDNANWFWDNTNKRLGLGTNTSLLGKLHVLIGSSTERAHFIKAASSQSELISEIQNNAGSIINGVMNDGSYLIPTTNVVNSTQRISVKGTPGGFSNYAFVVDRNQSQNNAGNWVGLYLRDNGVEVSMRCVTNGFTQGVVDLELHNQNGKCYAAPYAGGNYYYNPVTNTTDLSILRVPTQNMAPGGGTSSPQGALRVSVITTGATSPVSIEDVAAQWIEGAPTQGINMTITRRIASLIETGDAGGYAQIIRGYTSQTANVAEWQDVSKNTRISVDGSYRLNLHAQNEIRFQDSSGGEYAAFKAPSTIGSSHTYTLPTAVGSAGQYLKASDGTGTLTWDTPAGGSTPSISRHFAFMGA